MVSAAVLDEFRKILDATGVLVAPHEKAPYERDARGTHCQASAVVRPRDASELRGIVRLAMRHRVPIVAQGANTGLAAGAIPAPGSNAVIMSFERMRGAPVVDLANRSVRVEPGVRLSTLNEYLEPHGFYVPIDLGADPSIGGMLASNTGGARYLRYGGMREQALGLTVVLRNPEATLLTLGRGLRKDNSCMDLKHLFIGSGDRLGFIVEAELQVHPLPTARAACLAVPADDGAAFTVLTALERRFAERLTAFELMSRGAMTAALSHAPSLRDPFAPDPVPEFALLVEVEARGPRPDERESDLQETLAELYDPDAGPLIDARLGDPGALWALRHALTEGLRAAGDFVACDVSFRRGDALRFRRAMIERAAEAFPEFDVCDFGHLGDGGLHFNALARRGVCVERKRAFRTAVFDCAVHEFGGSFSAEHGLGPSNAIYYDRFTTLEIKKIINKVDGVFRSG